MTGTCYERDHQVLIVVIPTRPIRAEAEDLLFAGALGTAEPYTAEPY
jgi:hypothetical protein